MARLGTPEIEQIGDSVGRDAERIAGAGIGIDPVQIVPLQPAVVVCRDADEYARRRAGEALRHLACVLQGFPSHLQQQTLLRVHAGRLARRDAEEMGIELIYPLQKAAPPRVHLARRRWIRVVERMLIEAIGRDFHGSHPPRLAGAAKTRRGRWRLEIGSPCR